MPSLLRLRPEGPQWPYSVAQFRADEPSLSISSNPHAGELASYAALEPPILVHQVADTAPPEIDGRTQRLLPVKAEEVNGTWQQVWPVRDATAAEIEEYDAANQPPPPLPNFVAFNEALLTENGFEAVWSAVLNIEPMLAIAMPAYLETFRTNGDWSQYLISLSKAIALLETDEQRQYIVSELLALSQRCNLPNSFIAALQALIQPPPE